MPFARLPLRLGRLSAWLMLALLSACATPRPASAPEAGVLSGRLSVQVAAVGDGQPSHGTSGAFDLTGDAVQGQFQLSTPFGNAVARARWRPGAVELVTGAGTRQFADLDTLAEEMLGEALPLAALIDWLHGRPWPGAASRPTDQQAGFEQLGWTVDLARFEEGFVVARRLQAPEVTLRARVDRAP